MILASRLILQLTVNSSRNRLSKLQSHIIGQEFREIINVCEFNEQIKSQSQSEFLNCQTNKCTYINSFVFNQIIQYQYFRTMINFRTQYSKTKQALEYELSQISSAIKDISYIELQNFEYDLVAEPRDPESNKLIPDNDVVIGSRVLCTYGNRNKVHGRLVWIDSKKKLIVIRDGHTPPWPFERAGVKNLSVGVFGKLERRVWQIKRRLEEIEIALKNSLLPVCFQEDGTYYIEVVKILMFPEVEHRRRSFDEIRFVHSKNNESYRIKLPRGYVTQNGFFQVRVNEKDIVELLESSQRVFLEHKNL